MAWFHEEWYQLLQDISITEFKCLELVDTDGNS